jgi:ABC-type nitrate/sulfonate/bicarbonate transport system substrate-binding protein
VESVFDYYTPVVIANKTFLEEHPDTARAFLAALARGYQFAIDDPEAAAELLMEAAPELRGSSELVTRSQQYLSEQYQAEADRWGVFDPDRWSAYYTWLNENDLLENGSIDPLAGFTNGYLPED